VPSQHRYQPMSIRLPEHLRDWLAVYAERHDRPVRSVVIEAIEEYRARREHEESRMQAVTIEHARDYLRTAFAFNFLRPDQSGAAPIWFPGIEYRQDGTLSAEGKVKATEHLVGVLRDNGYVLNFDDDRDARIALHHVLWDQWTKDEIGNGRFTGRMFDDYGRIYHGCTAIDAANYTVERLSSLGGNLRSYTVQEDGLQDVPAAQVVRYLAANGTSHLFTTTGGTETGLVWVPAWLGATEPGLRWITEELKILTSARDGQNGQATFRVPRNDWMARIGPTGTPASQT